MSKLDSANRNILLNSSFPLFQRGTTANLSTSMAYVGPDRFRVGYTGTVTGTPTCSQSTNVPTNGKSLNSLALVAQRNASTLDLMVAQRIESLTAVECSNEIVSLSFQYVSPVATQAIITIRVPTVADNYATSNVIYTQTLPLTVGAAFNLSSVEGISLPDVSKGFEVEIKLKLQNGTDASPVTHYITQIKLNRGRKALGYTMCGVDITSETDKCFRYYEVLTGCYLFGYNNGSSYFGFRSVKRVLPTLTTTVISNSNAPSANLLNNTLHGVCYSASVPSSGIYTNGFNIFADAEI